MAGKGKASKTKIKDKKKSSSQTSGTTIKDEIMENQDTEPRFGSILGPVRLSVDRSDNYQGQNLYKVDKSIETAPESVEIPETETGIEVKPEPPKLDPVTSLYPFLINSWSGECLEGVPHGFGRCEFKSGTVYVGNMSYGLMHGKGMVAIREPSTVPKYGLFHYPTYVR